MNCCAAERHDVELKIAIGESVAKREVDDEGVDLFVCEP